MKKFLIAIIALAGFTTAGFAQTATQKKAAAPAKTTVAVKSVAHTTPATAAQKPAVKTETKTKTVTTKPAVAAAPAPAAKTKTSTTVVLKKDGTPDKRYKASTSTAGPVKKDGTPDMRYKANKKP